MMEYRFQIIVLTHLCRVSHKTDIAQQCGLNQTPKNAASDQGLHYTVIIKTNQTSRLLENDMFKIVDVAESTRHKRVNP